MALQVGFDASELRSIYAKMQKMLEDNKKILVENHERFKRDDVDNKIPPLNLKEEMIEAMQGVMQLSLVQLKAVQHNTDARLGLGLGLNPAEERQHLEAVVAWCKWAVVLIKDSHDI
jgi:hypothetical protein